MYGKNLSYLYVLYDELEYDLYGLYDTLGRKSPPNLQLNPYGSHGYV